MQSKQRRIPIDSSLGALQQLARLLDAHPKVLATLGRTQADRDYLRQGLAGAITQLQFVRQHQVAIRAALSSLTEAERATRNESVQS